MKALTLISLLALPLAQSAPCVDVRQMIDAGDFSPHFPTVSDIKRQFPSAEAFDCGGESCYSVRVGPGKWFVFHVTSEGDSESAEISEIAELGFPPTRALADQETHVDTARMDLAGCTWARRWQVFRTCGKALQPIPKAWRDASSTYTNDMSARQTPTCGIASAFGRA